MAREAGHAVSRNTVMRCLPEVCRPRERLARQSRQKTAPARLTFAHDASRMREGPVSTGLDPAGSAWKNRGKVGGRTMLLEGFTRTSIETSGARILTAIGGSGPPVLLMHGNPFTHLSW